MYYNIAMWIEFELAYDSKINIAIEIVSILINLSKAFYQNLNSNTHLDNIHVHEQPHQFLFHSVHHKYHNLR